MRKCKLGSILKIKHGYAFKSENYIDSSKFRLLTLGNFTDTNNFKFNELKATYYGADFPSDFILSEGDLVMPLTEQVVGLFGNSAFVPKTRGYQFVLNQRVGKVIPNNDLVDTYYLHYLLSTELVRNQLEARASGTRQRNLSPENIYDVEVELPNIDMQKKIGEFLYKIEKKINMNDVIIQELETLITTFFDYWFVQFDFPNGEGKPYKSSGGLMVFNEDLKRELPLDWKVDKFLELGDIVSGGTPKTSNPDYYAGDGIAWITPNDLAKTSQKYIAYGERNITELGLKESSAKLIPKGSVLISTRAPIGYIAIALNDVSTNQGFKSVVPKQKYGSEYVYYVVKSNINAIEQLGSGTTFMEVSKDSISNYKLLFPPQQLIDNFNKKIQFISKKMMLIEDETKELTRLKAWLLPMIMNGQMTFKDLKNKIGDAYEYK